jgi:hypothetical protein
MTAALSLFDRRVVCAVGAQHVRFDVHADGVVYLGALVHGAGGILGSSLSPVAALHRLQRSIAKGLPVRVYTRRDAQGDECVEVPAGEVRAVTLAKGSP